MICNRLQCHTFRANDQERDATQADRQTSDRTLRQRRTATGRDRAELWVFKGFGPRQIYGPVNVRMRY